MAIKRKDYPPNWHELSRYIRVKRAGERCECTGECGLNHPDGRCDELDGFKARSFRGNVMLTVAHLNHDTTSADPDNLRAMCQRCHLRYDIDHHVTNAKATRNRKRRLEMLEAGQLELL
ncbi:MAG: hypothetical protein NWE95_13750 [Candidatus Bathyarchaeota archaeon]|nr:hypothetical protein [Candidatus Bathyarchaeota archaeon]